MAISPGEVVRISARMINSVSGEVVNVFHAIHSGDVDVTDDDVLTAVEAWLNTMFQAINDQLSVLQDLFDIKIDVVGFANGEYVTVRPVGIVPWNGLGEPAGTGDAMPEGVALVVNLRTATSGVVGRKYLGVPTENAIVSGVPTSATQTALASFLGVLESGFVAAAEDFVAGVMSTKMQGFVPILEGVVRLFAGYQRRRTRGRGA